MFGVVFLWSLALAWIIFATIQDLKSREIANWLNFSLIIFALGFRFFYSLFAAEGFSFFYQGLIGFGIFFALGNALYYSKMFAGGDAKLMYSLGAVLPIYGTILENVELFLLFLLLFFFSGAVYSLVASGELIIKNFKGFRKEFRRQFNLHKKMFYLVFGLGIIIMFLAFIEVSLFVFGIFLVLTSYLYLFAKAIDESCMVKEVSTEKLSEGDWLYADTKVGRKIIKAKWDGLSKQEIKILKKKYKNVKIKQGVPFTPAFLISMALLLALYLLDIDLWNLLF